MLLATQWHQPLVAGEPPSHPDHQLDCFKTVKRDEKVKEKSEKGEKTKRFCKECCLRVSCN